MGHPEGTTGLPCQRCSVRKKKAELHDVRMRVYCPCKLSLEAQRKHTCTFPTKRARSKKRKVQAGQGGDEESEEGGGVDIVSGEEGSDREASPSTSVSASSCGAASSEQIAGPSFGLAGQPPTLPPHLSEAFAPTGAASHGAKPLPNTQGDTGIQIAVRNLLEAFFAINDTSINARVDGMGKTRLDMIVEDEMTPVEALSSSESEAPPAVEIDSEGEGRRGHGG
uniref:Uncharacterized protein n=1 Tax=Chromera velia CCMP2878 TaxID=1169474 RepID=A0A0G4GP16_9ALVE|eukprot:Cvel_4996.t1-p1 / transcript=Cvel_4996.t1 / gene=Cvel_4996 / organism=Chromera_velia_CCMP2878 / gene_product=hypothetical protein / transcript_product=hypothetical protein / location=Cvel_scaffold226:50625-52845(-) / protein_length=223 / sequence_SO=supercontig / SO=protein_coding / is_pseudo=false